MNLNRTSHSFLHLAIGLGDRLRKLLPTQTSKAFGMYRNFEFPTIEKIYAINLDRELDRWSRLKEELRRIQDRYGNDLLSLTERYGAVDARNFLQDPPNDAEVNPYYTLSDQLFVEPQPQALPTRFELEAPIRMSRAEIAVAKSHIEIWKRVAKGSQSHSLILEDDVWFHPNFAKYLDQAWKEISAQELESELDVLYVSYMEARNGAPKQIISSHLFKPERGLWYLSGYILSKKGAEKLLASLPCRGPVDLWINHQFSELNVLATNRTIVQQRKDATTTNSYSILPTLSTIGAIDSEGAALFNSRPPKKPVFVFGPANSGQSTVAMALSMLGYRCCSDLKELPRHELARLRKGRHNRVFGAYVNVGCLDSIVEDLRDNYPEAKFIVTKSTSESGMQSTEAFLSDLRGADVIALDTGDARAWQILCEHLRCVPPMCPFPRLPDLGQRHILEQSDQLQKHSTTKWDRSPWVIEPDFSDWKGIKTIARLPECDTNSVHFEGGKETLDSQYWTARSDTFTGNLALFRPRNVVKDGDEGATIQIMREDLGVRQYSAGALASIADNLYGRFEATFQACDVPGVITGFFLHRNSPHQEIDIEIPGNMPNRMLVNVFYNPGSEGAKFDYGYRGCPSYIDLGFDASKAMHTYAIEWSPGEICWLVDDAIVHRRLLWDPTPIPHLPMKLHFNAWPSRANELAGRLKTRRLPAEAKVQSLRTQTYRPSMLGEQDRVLLSTELLNSSGVSE